MNLLGKSRNLTKQMHFILVNLNILWWTDTGCFRVSQLQMTEIGTRLHFSSANCTLNIFLCQLEWIKLGLIQSCNWHLLCNWNRYLMANLYLVLSCQIVALKFHFELVGECLRMRHIKSLYLWLLRHLEYYFVLEKVLVFSLALYHWTVFALWHTHGFQH